MENIYPFIALFQRLKIIEMRARYSIMQKFKKKKMPEIEGTFFLDDKFQLQHFTVNQTKSRTK